MHLTINFHEAVRLATLWNAGARKTITSDQIDVITQWVTAIAPVLTRLIAYEKGIGSEYHPTCQSSNYGDGCAGAVDEDVAFWGYAVELVRLLNRSDS